MSDKVGQQIGNYRLVRLLGSGGFAEVYLGQHIHLASKQAAIKLLHLIDVDVKKFQEEAETTEQLVHPHIVRLLDFVLQEGTPFLVLDFAPGGSLRSRHPKGSQLPLITVVGYLKEIVPALQYAHDSNILHRDIKPDNMLIGRQGELLISDFGIAVLSQTGRTSLEASYGIGGTAFYMAPEQYRGKPEKASDLYSLAVVVYEWLCGSVPFSEGGFIQLGYQHTHEPVPSLCEKNPRLSSDVEAVILTALAKDPKQRFGSVRAFANALEQACSLPSQKAPQTVEPVPSQSTHAGIPTIQVTPQKEVLSQQPEPSAAAAKYVSEQIESVRPTELPVQTRSVTQLPWQIGTVSSQTAPVAPSTGVGDLPGLSRYSVRFTRRQTLLILGLAGAGLAATGIGVGWWELAHRSVIPLGTTLYTYRGHSAGVYAVAWSPDGKRIASGSYDKTVQVWDAADGGNVFTYRGHSDGVLAVAWSPDGKKIASCDDHSLQLWDAVDGSHVYTFHNQVEKVAWSPDSRRLAVSSSGAQIWDAGKGTVLVRNLPSSPTGAVAWSPNGAYIASGSVSDVRVWDATTGNTLYTYHGHSSFVDAVSWSPHSKSIASAGLDGTVQIWDALTGSDSFTYRGHSNTGTSQVFAVSWSPDGRYIASGGTGYGGNTIQKWDAADGGHGYIFPASGFAVEWSPDSTRIASAGIGNIVQVWQAV